MLRANLSFLTLTFLFVTGACDPKSGETDSATGSTSTSGDATTDASTTDESPTSSATTGEEPGTGTGDDEPTVATSGEDTGDTTGPVGPVDPAHQSACEAACQHFAECQPDNAVAECVLGCTSEFEELPPDCAAANLAFVECIPELSCVELEEQTDEGPCGDELDALLACDGGECTQAINDEGGDACGVSTYCPGEPAQEFYCEGDTCFCTLDDVEVAQCPADGVCAEGDAIFDKMQSCCGFE